MTDRLNGLTVVLEQNIRDDDAQPLIDAIKQMRGVLDVCPLVAHFDEHAAEIRVRRELGKALFDVIYPETKERNG